MQQKEDSSSDKQALENFYRILAAENAEKSFRKLPVEDLEGIAQLPEDENLEEKYGRVSALFSNTIAALEDSSATLPKEEKESIEKEFISLTQELIQLPTEDSIRMYDDLVAQAQKLMASPQWKGSQPPPKPPVKLTADQIEKLSSVPTEFQRNLQNATRGVRSGTTDESSDREMLAQQLREDAETQKAQEAREREERAQGAAQHLKSASSPSFLEQLRAHGGVGALRKTNHDSNKAHSAPTSIGAILSSISRPDLHLDPEDQAALENDWED